MWDSLYSTKYSSHSVLQNHAQCSERFWTKLIKIQVFPCPTGYMLMSCNFPLLNLKYILKDLPLKALELEPISSQIQPAHRVATVFIAS